MTSPAADSVLRGPGAIAVAMGVMNVATYGFTIVAARLLGPQSYGALASLLATLLVIGVLQLSFQATAARRISADPQHVAQIEKTVLGVTYRASLAIGLVLLVLTPVVNRVLKLDSLATAALVAVTAVPITMMGGQAGVLQGERRWWPLAVLYVANGVPRLVIGTALILWRPDETTAMLGVAIGSLPPVVIGWLALRGHRVPGVVSEEHGFRDVMREILHNSQALLAFFALSSADIIVARNVLPQHSAGLYAGGLILTKAVLFLPQFVIIVAFPSMSTADERRHALTRSLLVVGGLGVCATLGALVLRNVALVFVGGDDYREIASTLWVFAILGTALSMLQLLVYSVLARQGKRSVYLVWAAFLVLVGVGYFVSTLHQLITLVVTTDLVLFALLLALSLYTLRKDDERLAEVVDPGINGA
ncbi:polysaccharide biosynthesis protein [Nocardioides pocheonensis]|uniref:Polysaccharide biosynthesis protein n=1 Tax=Nocardioides pocheonensis TaxID=661485 RepID=A0A3N0GU76_9ACTN|nr:polysaccharide biosynthesis protein [Nocardioides pocheonensis]